MGWLAAAGGIQAGLSYLGQGQTNAMNMAMMQQQENYMTQMSNTAHQREVVDLEKAGLNPILSAGGSGAMVPTPGLPTMGSPVSALATSAQDATKSVIDLLGTAANAEKNHAAAQVDLKTAAEKSPAAAVGSDLTDVYNMIKQRFKDLYNQGRSAWNAYSSDPQVQSDVNNQMWHMVPGVSR